MCIMSVARVVHHVFQVVFEDCALACLEAFGSVSSIFLSLIHTHTHMQGDDLRLYLMQENQKQISHT